MAPCLYGFIRKFAKFGVHLFFRDIHILNEANIPKDGPIIIVANHNNQFIDAGMVLNVFDQRVVSFIIAEASMHRPIVGDIARGLRAVPVIRAQDRAKVGSGGICGIDPEANVLSGVGTKFVKEATVGGKISMNGICEFTIGEIISDTEIRYKADDETKKDVENLSKKLAEQMESNANLPFKIFPKIDQKEVYAEVYKRLLDGGAISIFPEGGSHDQTKLLPLKAGVAIMTLGAIAKGAPVKIVPLGINYLQAYSFRSRVICDVGTPFECPQELLDLYNGGNRREAYEGFMQKVKEGMESVTLTAPSFNVLSRLRTARRLYQNGAELKSHDYLTLYRRFLKGYETWKDEPEFDKLMNDIGNYLDHAHSIGLDDKGVRDLPIRNSCYTWLKTWNQIWLSLFVILILFVIALPGLILNYPIYFLISRKVKKEVKKALVKSTVKVKALDVAASQKALNFIKYLPLVYLFNALVCGLLVGFLWDIEPDEDAQWKEWFADNVFWFIPLCLLIVLPFYTYFVVLVIESGLARIRLLPIRLHAVWTIYKRKAPKCCGGITRLSPSVDIRLERRNLVIRTQDIVRELTKDEYEWQQNPIITETEIMAQRNKNLTSLVDYVLSHHRESDHNLLGSIGDEDINAILSERGASLENLGGAELASHYL
mmetsp:Transcript_44/g.79  ORF Transcript_44/g.79 Transcript_44/m.79 type:complete len:656 (+) Transcript_44:374-2341(+)